MFLESYRRGEQEDTVMDMDVKASKSVNIVGGLFPLFFAPLNVSLSIYIKKRKGGGMHMAD